MNRETAKTKILAATAHSLLLCILLAGCTTKMSLIQPRVQIFDAPKLNEVRTAELGDTIIDKGELRVYDAIDLKNEVHFGDGILLKKLTVPPGKLLAKGENDKRIYYFSDKFTVYDALIGKTPT